MNNLQQQTKIQSLMRIKGLSMPDIHRYLIDHIEISESNLHKRIGLSRGGKIPIELLCHVSNALGVPASEIGSEEYQRIEELIRQQILSHRAVLPTSVTGINIKLMELDKDYHTFKKGDLITIDTNLTKIQGGLYVATDDNLYAVIDSNNPVDVPVEYYVIGKITSHTTKLG